MWKVLIISLLSALAVHGKELKNGDGQVTDKCRSDMTMCANRVMGQGRCRSLWSSLVLQMIRSDMDNNCYVDGDDIEDYLEINFDTNDDKKVCEKEWRTFMESYLGYSTEAAVGIFQKKYAKDMSPMKCVDIEDMDEVSSKKLKSDFLNELIQDLVTFCSMGQNMMTNRDCWGLVSTCQMVPTMKACKSSILNNKRTLYEKLMVVQRTIDTNHDGFISRAEFNHELQRMDTGNNGCVSTVEWVARYTGVYQFTDAASRAFFNSIISDVDNNNCIDISDFTYARLLANAMVDSMMNNLITLCEHNPGLYSTDKECVTLAETCRSHFQKLEKCSVFSDKVCGLAPYSGCVKQLSKTGGSCLSKADMFEVKLETYKIDNQINKTCTARNSGTKTTGTNPVLLFLTTLPLLFFMVHQ